MRLLVCIALALLAGTGPRAQETGVIWGTLTDADTGNGLIGATVTVLGTEIGAVTDLDGRYRAEGVPRGALALQASYVGYRPEVVEAVLAADSLRLDVALSPACLESVELSVAEYPRGTVSDLPALDARLPSRVARESRAVETVAAEPLAARAARAVAWDRGADALGRWRPAMRALGRPQAYVGGLPALSLDAVPVGSATRVGAFGGYLPARYGGSAAGATVVEAEAGGAREAFGGVTGDRTAAALRYAATRRRSDPERCGALLSRTGVAGEARATAGGGDLRSDGRALVVQDWRRVGLTAHVRGDATSTAAGEGGSLGGVVDVRSGVYEPVLLTVGADHGWGPGGASTLVAGRTEANWQTWRSHDEVQVGVEASARSGVGATASSVAVYGERRFDEYLARFRRWAVLTVGGRVERFGLDGRAVWAFQPRVQLEAGRRDRAAYLYGVGLSAPGADGTVWRRAEAGLGARSRVLGWRSPVRLTAGAHGYLRSVEGARRGEVVGLDVEVVAVADARPLRGLELSLRSRTEWGDAEIARARRTAALTVWVDEYGRSRGLGGVYHLAVDLADGVGGRPVVEVVGEATPWWLGAVARGVGVQRPLSLLGRGVVVGRDAVPCAGGLGAVACPSPVVEVTLRVGG